MFGCRKTDTASQNKFKKCDFDLQPFLKNVQPIGKIFTFAVSLEWIILAFLYSRYLLFVSFSTNYYQYINQQQ